MYGIVIYVVGIILTCQINHVCWNALLPFNAFIDSLEKSSLCRVTFFRMASGAGASANEVEVSSADSQSEDSSS